MAQNPFEFTVAQQTIPALRAPGPRVFGKRAWPGWSQPFCDANLMRPLDTARVGRLGDSPWRTDGNPDVRNDRVGPPRSHVPWPGSDMHGGGNPVQRAHATRTVPVTAMHMWRGISPTVHIPAPDAGWLWVEGNPWPAWRMATDNTRDCHARIITETGESWEMVGAQPVHASWGLEQIRCSKLAHYSAAGDLLDGTDHVTKGRIQATRLLLGRNEAPHRLGLVVRGDDRDPNAQPIDQWLGLDPETVPWDTLTMDAHRVATMLVEHGCYTFDRGGHSALASVSGADWAGVDFGGWAPRMGDFRRVVEAG